MAVQENGSEQQLEEGNDAFSHSPSSTFFLERLMSDSLEELDRIGRIGRKTFTNLRFAVDIDALSKKVQKLEFRQYLYKI